MRGDIQFPAVVAIPAKDEADRIGRCLAAFAMQRDRAGAPIAAGTFAVLVFANNCRDGTAAEAYRWAALSPHPILVVEEAVAAVDAHAGYARRRAMDLALDRLAPGGLLLTSDADSVVAPDWIAATLDWIEGGADAVAGYIDADPAELLQLGPAFLRRSRLEDHYLRCLAEIDALCDPRPHNPWPTHRVSSGASLAVTAMAYREIGGLPAIPLGEDVALTRTLDSGGFRVRHAMDVSVMTSCRLDGRVEGGAAATMRVRQAEPDIACGDEVEPVAAALRRAGLRGRLRRVLDEGRDPGPLLARLRVPASLLDFQKDEPPEFATLWSRLTELSPRLSSRGPLRPSNLEAETARAERALLLLRRRQPAERRSSR